MDNNQRTVILASDPFPPYQYYDDTGNLAGMDYSLVSEVTRRSGHVPKVILDDWGKVNDMLRAHEIDALFQIAPTPERLARGHFSKPYRDAVTELVTADGDLVVPYYAALAAAGLKVGMIKGYVYGDAFDNLPDEMKVEYDTAEEELLAVSRKEIPLAVFDQGVRLLFCEKLGIQNLRELENLSFGRPMFVMFNDAQLCADFNGALEPFLKERDG